MTEEGRALLVDEARVIDAMISRATQHDVGTSTCRALIRHTIESADRFEADVTTHEADPTRPWIVTVPTEIVGGGVVEVETVQSAAEHRQWIAEEVANLRAKVSQIQNDL